MIPDNAMPPPATIRFSPLQEERFNGQPEKTFLTISKNLEFLTAL
jgi:hypothetical protein